MKALARSYLWWPGLDRELEELAKACTQCQKEQSSPAVAPLHPWSWLTRPWAKIHLDFAGPFQERMFLVAIDAHSKWPEVVEMATLTATQTVAVLRKMFAANGLPEQVVSDNGPQFVSEEFASFCQFNGIKHIRVSPYHRSSNGLAERFVQTFKVAMSKSEKDGLLFSHRLASFLLLYRARPKGTTAVPPSVLFIGHSLCTRLDLLRPNPGTTVVSNQASQKQKHDRDFHRSPSWVPATIMKELGPVSFMVQTSSGLLWKWHLDHTHVRVENSTPEAEPHGEGEKEFPNFAAQRLSPLLTVTVRSRFRPPNQTQLHHSVIRHETSNRLNSLVFDS